MAKLRGMNERIRTQDRSSVTTRFILTWKEQKSRQTFTEKTMEIFNSGYESDDSERIFFQEDIISWRRRTEVGEKEKILRHLRHSRNFAATAKRI